MGMLRVDVLRRKITDVDSGKGWSPQGDDVSEPSTCSQCGQRWAAPAYGPSHAGIHAWRIDGRREAFEEAAKIADGWDFGEVIAKEIRARAEEEAK